MAITITRRADNIVATTVSATSAVRTPEISATEIYTVSGTPATSSANGTAGQIKFDSTHVYVCITANTWKRAAIAGW